MIHSAPTITNQKTVSMPKPSPYLILLGAVLSEVAATSALKASERFTKPLPSAFVILGYGVAFWLLSLTLDRIPTGVAYAIWSGLGVVLIAVLSRVFYGQRLDTPAILGLGLILAGVLVINLFSKTVAH